MQRELLQRLRQSIIEAFLLRALGVGLVFALHLVLTNSLTLDGYGLFSYTLSITEVLIVFAPLGFPNALLRFLPEYKEQLLWSLFKGILRRAHEVTIISAALLSIVLWYISTTPYLLSGELSTSFKYVPILLLPLAIIKLRTRAFQALQDARTSIILESTLLPIVSIAIILMLKVETAVDAIFTYGGSALLIAIIGTAWLQRNMPVETDNVKPQFKTQYWINIALPMVFGGVGQIIMNRTDTLMIGAIANMTAVGLYSSALRVSRLNIFVLEAVNTVVPSMLAGAYHRNDYATFKALLYKSMLWSTLATLPILASMLLFPGRILVLFGAEFVQGASLLQILAIGQFFNAVTGPVGFILAVTGHERKFAKIITSTATVNILGNLIAVPLWGALGAAIVTAFSTVLSNSLMFIQVRIIMANHSA